MSKGVPMSHEQGGVHLAQVHCRAAPTVSTTSRHDTSGNVLPQFPGTPFAMGHGHFLTHRPRAHPFSWARSTPLLIGRWHTHFFSGGPSDGRKRARYAFNRGDMEVDPSKTALCVWWWWWTASGTMRDQTCLVRLVAALRKPPSKKSECLIASDTPNCSTEMLQTRAFFSV